MECFELIVNACKALVFVTKNCILDVAAVIDLPLKLAFNFSKPLLETTEPCFKSVSKLYLSVSKLWAYFTHWPSVSAVAFEQANAGLIITICIKSIIKKKVFNCYCICRSAMEWSITASRIIPADVIGWLILDLHIDII